MKQYFRETIKRVTMGITKNLDFPPHIHEDVELVYMVRGTCTAYCQEKRYDLTPGDFFLVFPEQVHHYFNSIDCEAYLVIVNPSFLPRYSGILRQKAPTSAVLPNDDEDLVALLRMANKEHQASGDRAMILDLLTVCFGKLLNRCQLDTQLKEDGTVAQIVKYCSTHYKEPITIQSVAKELYLSQSHISHTFHNKMNITFPNYVNSLRLDDAVHLLELSGHTIEQIAELSGFPTVRTFNRVFRAKFGLSPSQYRKSSL